VTWYNNVHLHSAIKFVTPAQRHSGKDDAIRVKRNNVYQMAKLQRPGRWSGSTRNWLITKVATLNPNKKSEKKEGKK
jgi:putative transposase